MSLPRLGVLIVGLAGLALIVVHLRAQQNRTAATILTLEADWMRLRSEWWSLQTRSARLRSPQRVRDRIWRMGFLRAGPHRLSSPSTQLSLSASRP